MSEPPRAGSLPAPDPEDAPFSELIAVVRDSDGFLVDILEQVTDVAALPSETRRALQLTQGVIPARAADLVAAIRTGEHDALLHLHSLGDDDAGWSLKYVQYFRARRDLERRREQGAGPGQAGVRRFLRWTQRPLKWLNVILGSVADVIPGAGGAYKELKETTEAVVDDALGDTGDVPPS